MKKILIFLFLIVVLAACDMSGNTTIVVPGENNAPVVTPDPTQPGTPPVTDHTHIYSEEWKYDELNHWHECGCGDFKEKNIHSWEQTSVKVEQTETVEGIIIETCSVCLKTKETNIGIANHEHTFSSDWTSDELGHWHEATCGHNIESDYSAHTGGEATETEKAKCTICNTAYGSLKEEVVKELSVPVLSLNEETGEVSWDAVDGATHYNYIINGGEVQTTLELSVVLSNESNISVQAANNNSLSSYSKAVTFYDLSDIVIAEEKDVYVYFHNTNLEPQLVALGDTVTKPVGLIKENYVFEDFYEDPFYQNKFDFDKPIEKATVIYANWIPSDLIKDTYFWVKGSPKMTSNIMSAGTKSDWHFIPLKVNQGQTEFKEFYVTVSVSGASVADPCYFIVMDGFDDNSTDKGGRSYWKKADGTDFTIKADGIYNIYFSVEHQYAAGVHISVGAATNTSATLNGKLNIGLDTPIVNIDKENNKATWNKVDGATKYEVVINNAESIFVTTTSVDLPVKSHISVRALSEVSSSKWSSPKANLNYVVEKEESEYIYVYFKGLESIKVNKNNPVTEPNNPILDGHTFGGWYYDLACTKQVVFPVMLQENTTIYPKWNLSGNYTTDVYYNLVTSTGEVVKGLVWNLDNYNYDEYETGDIALTANTNYYIESLDKSQKWGPYKVNSTGDYKVYFSPDYCWDNEMESERNAYFAKQVYEITVYFSNNKHWSGDIKAYIWNSSTNKPLSSWPGTKMEFVETNNYGEDIYKVTIDLTQYDYIIFTNGSNQTKDISLANVSTGTGYYLTGDKDVGSYKYE